MEQRIIADRYALVVELGRGAMGVVWRAHDRLLDRPLAIKELHPPHGLSTEDKRVLQERLLREARNAGKLNHPAVVTVHDVISEGGRTFLAMELVDAANLSALIERFGALDSTWVAGVAAQALSALDCAHQAGIVHRDVKPSNIMVRPDNVVKLADFGIAQAIDDPKLTTNGVIGSPAYMSPERLAGADASPASDLWALGVTIAHAVEGVSPFERSSTASTLHAVMSEEPKLAQASPALAEVIRGLLAADPRRRLSAAQAHAMLTEIAGGAGPSARPRLAGRHRTPIRIAAAASAVVLVAAGGFAVHQLTRPHDSAAAPAATTGAVLAPDGAAPAQQAPEQTDAKPIENSQATTFGRGGEVPEFYLSENECAQEFLAVGKKVADKVPCETPHGIQLFGAATPFWDKPKSTPYPGLDWLVEYGRKYCADQFNSTHVSHPEGRDVLASTVLVPTEQEWNAWNDQVAPGHQEVLCVTWRADRSTLAASVVVA